MGFAGIAAATGIAFVLLFHVAAVDRPLFASSLPIRKATADFSGYRVERVAAKVLPSVVTLRMNDGDQSALGSGIILTPDGLILTNSHVVGPGPRASARTLVTLNDGRTAAFDVIAADPQSDIAVVRAHKLSGLTPISVGSQPTCASVSR